MSFKLLSEPIQKYIYDKNWESLRPIQASAISKIITTENNYILASRTASGKTEAAFLPILSKTNFSEIGVKVLYISPLIALINDQFFRIEELCKNLSINITKWHGEANRSLKKKLISNPNGIVLITPESLEAMFVNSSQNISTLFSNLEYLVIDEIHSFIGVDRGIQLTSLLSRLQEVNKKKFKTIGLSATIGDENYIEAKKITGDIENTKVLLDRTKKDILANFFYYENTTNELSLDLIKDLYIQTKNYKTLIFPNSRGRTEEIAVKLKKISERLNGHNNYFSHHSSIDKEIRESIEFFAKNNERFNFCISCTSTLELGIDIGTVNKVVQIDSTHSVASLVQRIGRSGRKENELSILDLYSTDKWNFLQSLACWSLYKSDFLEPIKNSDKAYDILFHQMLSIVKQKSVCTQKELISLLSKNSAFKNIDEFDIKKIIQESIKSDYLELIQNEIILGIEGEKIVNTKEFYSVFKTDPSYKIINYGKKIGEIPLCNKIKIDDNILLAAKIWKIKDIDLNNYKVEVIPAKDGKKPIFLSSGANIHAKIREKMLKILKSNQKFNEIDDKCLNILQELQYDFKNFLISDFKYDRPIIVTEKALEFYSFSGTKVNKSLEFLINLTETNVSINEHKSSFVIQIELENFNSLLNEINTKYKDIDKYIEKEILNNDSLLSFSKWGKYLPINYQIEILKDRYFDFDETISFLNKIKFIKMD